MSLKEEFCTNGWVDLTDNSQNGIVVLLTRDEKKNKNDQFYKTPKESATKDTCENLKEIKSKCSMLKISRVSDFQYIKINLILIY